MGGEGFCGGGAFCAFMIHCPCMGVISPQSSKGGGGGKTQRGGWHLHSEKASRRLCPVHNVALVSVLFVKSPVIFFAGEGEFKSDICIDRNVFSKVQGEGGC